MSMTFFRALVLGFDFFRLVVNQIIEEGSGEAYWKARVESQGKAGGQLGSRTFPQGLELQDISRHPTFDMQKK